MPISVLFWKSLSDSVSLSLSLKGKKRSLSRARRESVFSECHRSQVVRTRKRCFFVGSWFPSRATTSHHCRKTKMSPPPKKSKYSICPSVDSLDYCEPHDSQESSMSGGPVCPCFPSLFLPNDRAIFFSLRGPVYLWNGKQMMVGVLRSSQIGADVLWVASSSSSSLVDVFFGMYCTTQFHNNNNNNNNNQTNTPTTYITYVVNCTHPVQIHR